ncbi:MAG: aldehyde dehydrogenase family protein [Elusimicrobia bacterium]|nr:aldehyde dehydrogenase family protein [Elusimicrobiota bacterium]
MITENPDSFYLKEIPRVFEKQKASRWRVAQSTAQERIAKLNRLKSEIIRKREDLQAAMQADFSKNPGETDLTEIYPTLAEITHTVKHLKHWMKPVQVKAPAPLLGTRSEIRYEPKGLVLILSPWNYPFNLSMGPLIAAVSAGNCVILKPSAKVPQTARALKDLLAGVFAEDEVAVLQGSHAVSNALLELPFDHIFFTGSPNIGKTVMAAAAKNLTPVTLELGGKSPAVVDDTADIVKASERLAWGKFVNAGQTCVAPDYVLVHDSRKAEFVAKIKEVIAKRYGATEEARQGSPSYCRLVTGERLETLKKVLRETVSAGARVEIGGVAGDSERYLSPTVLTGVKEDSPIMQEEIFGPILPVLSYRNLDEAIGMIRSREKPLALYIFSENQANIERILRGTASGGSCINNTVIHVANPNLPFGGVGQSGMGNYHGFFGFKTFSHERGVLRQGWLDTLQFFYPPYTGKVKKLIYWTMRLFG